MNEKLLEQILSEMKGFKSELTQLRTEMESQGKALRSEMNDKFGSLRTEMNDQVGSLRSEMNKRFDRVDADLSVLKGGQQGVRNEITDRFRETNTHLNHLNRQMNLLDADYHLLLQKTAHTERDINRLVHENQ